MLCLRKAQLHREPWIVAWLLWGCVLSFYWVMLEAHNKCILCTEALNVIISAYPVLIWVTSQNITIWEQGGFCRFINSLKCVFDVSYPPPQHEMAPALQKNTTSGLRACTLQGLFLEGIQLTAESVHVINSNCCTHILCQNSTTTIPVSGYVNF